MFKTWMLVRVGGGRVIYLDVFEKESLYLIFAYPKNMQSDLRPEQKKAIRTTHNGCAHQEGVILWLIWCFNLHLQKKLMYLIQEDHTIVQKLQ